MTREQAVKVNKALENVEGFEIFMDEVLTAAENAKDTCDVFEFIPRLERFLRDELRIREEILDKI
jgi:hypothetical protein